MKKDGTLIWVDSIYGPVKDIFGKFIGACVIVQDITSQKVYKETLEASEGKFRDYIKMTENWIWEVDKRGEFIFSNEVSEKILGYKEKEIIGQSLFQFLSPEDKEMMKEQFQANIDHKRGWVHLVLPFFHKDGNIRWLESNASEFLDSNNTLVGFRGASRDITESKNLEKVKNEFISMVSHELRTPLTSIYGALTLLSSKNMKPENKEELIATAQRNSLRLTKLINDIIDVEKFQLGKIKFDFKVINLRNVVEESIQASSILAQKSNLQIITEGTLIDAEVNGDYTRLVQVMMNLLSNAYKFSPSQGKVCIAMEKRGAFARVSVTDQGGGIPKEFQAKIFEKFAQADSSAKRSSEGTGLGLNISKYIIEGHEGTIQYKTNEGDGTTFFFELPLYTAAKNRKGIPSAVYINKMKDG